MSVVVFGSINMDLVVRAPRLPRPGETLIGHGFTTVPGGKGANQAVAAARLGVATRMVGRVGDDVFGAQLRQNLANEGVDVARIASAAQTPSGIAAIAVDDAAENTIVVAPGANAAVGDEDIARLGLALEGAAVLLLQLEVPLEAVVNAAQAAHERGVIVILDPAPAQPLPGELYRAVDVITPNETEAAALVGFAVENVADAERAAELLCAEGAGAAVIKMGARGVYYLHGGERAFVPAFAVDAVDTVAAGDAFNGALAAALSEGLPFAEAIHWGVAGGALATTRLGAQSAMPAREELLALVQADTSR